MILINKYIEIHGQQNINFFFPFEEELREVLSQMYIGLHVKCPLFLSDLNETLIFSTDVQKLLKCLKPVKIRSVRAELLRADGRSDKTDMTKLLLFAVLRTCLKTDLSYMKGVKDLVAQ